MTSDSKKNIFVFHLQNSSGQFLEKWKKNFFESSLGAVHERRHQREGKRGDVRSLHTNFPSKGETCMKDQCRGFEFHTNSVGPF